MLYKLIYLYMCLNSNKYKPILIATFSIDTIGNGYVSSPLYVLKYPKKENYIQQFLSKIGYI